MVGRNISKVQHVSTPDPVHVGDRLAIAEDLDEHADQIEKVIRIFRDGLRGCERAEMETMVLSLRGKAFSLRQTCSPGPVDYDQARVTSILRNAVRPRKR